MKNFNVVCKLASLTILGFYFFDFFYITSKNKWLAEFLDFFQSSILYPIQILSDDWPIFQYSFGESPLHHLFTNNCNLVYLFYLILN